MTTSVTPFQFALADKAAEVRVVIREGEPWFVAKDVADILGYAKPRDAIASHCKGAAFHGLLTSGGQQDMQIIPERDLYRLVMRSKLPAAEAFEEWVVGEVLPSIRKTGYFAQDRWFTLEPIVKDASAASSHYADFWTERVRLAKELPVYRDLLLSVGQFTAVREDTIPLLLPFFLGGQTLKGLPDTYIEDLIADLRAQSAMTKDQFTHCANRLPEVRAQLKEIGCPVTVRNMLDLLDVEELLER